VDYVRFVSQRRPVWEDFERRLATARDQPKRLSHADLEALALRYRQVLHDHALAGARFAGTAAADRLRALALAGTHRLTEGSRDEGGGLAGFLTRTFPRAFQRQLDLIGVAVLLFLLGALWGLSVAALRPSVGLAFLGPRAIEGLEQGRMWTESLVTTTPPNISSSAIATNNISVALTAWTGGLLAGIGPLYVTLLNGFLLGAILGVTLHYGMAGELLAFISAHGPLEISLILVASAAGLGLGRALVVAGDEPRAASLARAGRDALHLLLGCLPWFVILALVEVLVSPSPLPVPFKLAIGLSLETLFLALAFLPQRP
jgi:uncharacterized membrane protein SpoIIM required for sporulation